MLNAGLLHPEVRHFLLENIHASPASLALAKSPFPGVTPAELATQLNGLQKAKTKLPLWYNTPSVYFPHALSLQQCSSQAAAFNKSFLLTGSTVADLTSGFGVDSAVFGLNGFNVTAFELQPQLAAINLHNSRNFNISSYNTYAINGLQYIIKNSLSFDSIYIDPARRQGDNRVINLTSYTPNIVPWLQNLLSLTPNLVIKTSPMVDVAAGLKQLQHVKHVQAVSYKNDCKELLWVLAPGESEVTFSASLLTDGQRDIYPISSTPCVVALSNQEVTAGAYIYDADVSITKLQGQNYFAQKKGLWALSKHSNLFISHTLTTGFPGRIYLAEEVLPAKNFMRLRNQVGNVLIRGFPGSAATLSAKYSKGAMPNQYLIFTNHHSMGNIVLRARLLKPGADY